MYYRLEILYTDLTTLVRYFEDYDAATYFVHNEGDHVMDYNIYEVI
jgi:hypothetical protein